VVLFKRKNLTTGGDKSLFGGWEEKGMTRRRRPLAYYRKGGKVRPIFAPKGRNRPTIIVLDERNISKKLSAFLRVHKDWIIRAAVRQVGAATLSSVAAIVFPQAAAMLGASSLTPTQRLFVENMIKKTFNL